jgi:hypothetical protein
MSRDTKATYKRLPTHGMGSIRSYAWNEKQRTLRGPWLYVRAEQHLCAGETSQISHTANWLIRHGYIDTYIDVIKGTSTAVTKAGLP